MCQKLKQIFNMYNIIIILLIPFLILCIWYIFYDSEVLSEEFYLSASIGIISLIGVISNMKHNNITRKQTNFLIEQNIETRFIQLRFECTKQVQNELLWILQSTMTIYSQLKIVKNEGNPFNSMVMSPRDFLILQFINLISNKNILFDLPVYLRSYLENKFKERVTYSNNMNNGIMTLIKNDSYLKVSIQIIDSMDEYKKYIKCFRDNLDNYKEKIFVSYQESNITEKEFENHFNSIINELANNNVEYLILKDKNLSFKKIDYKQYFKDN